MNRETFMAPCNSNQTSLGRIRASGLISADSPIPGVLDGSFNNMAWSVSPSWESLARQAAFQTSELAKLCGVSERTIQRRFEKYNIRLGAWLRELRLQHAYACLSKGKTVKEAAYESGYTQLSNFSRDFKALFGVPPRLLGRGIRQNCPEVEQTRGYSNGCAHET